MKDTNMIQSLYFILNALIVIGSLKFRAKNMRGYMVDLLVVL